VSPRVFVVGSINVDLVARVERQPSTGETVIGAAFSRHDGGKGANQAVAAARFGAEVGMIGAVGDDDLADGALDALVSEGIDVTGVRRLSGIHTGVALITVDATGDNRIAVASGANARLDPAEVARALTAAGLGAEDLVLSGFEVGDEAIAAAASCASKAGARSVLSPAPARPLEAAIVATRPLLVPNAGEASTLSGRSDPAEAARRLVESTGAPVVVTLGGDGALLVTPDGTLRGLPPIPTEVVDTTGAGDTLTGALAAELARGTDLAAAVELAMAAAACAISVVGARPGMPTRDGALAALARRRRAD
jgi:ribokinase